MDVSQALAAALHRVKTINSATLTYLSGSTTVSASVYKSFVKDYNRDMEDAGYSESYDNLFVLATPSDIESWGIVPMTSKVELDGVAYMVGRTTTTTPGYTTIWLRIKK